MKERQKEWLSKWKNLLAQTTGKLKKTLRAPKNRYLAIDLSATFFYAAGLLAQLLSDRGRWLPGQELHLPSLNPFRCFAIPGDSRFVLLDEQGGPNRYGV